MYLHYSAISDVGRVRRENQDSGYAGPWLLTVCDGVGGAVRGDLASSTAVQALRKLDQEPDDDILGQVAGAVHRADDRIAELVEEDPDLNGTSTTATVALFDGTRFGIGHIGDSRAYLYRRGELRQLTHDHTFVQSLIDEGRITEEQSRTHPHRNLILKALDGIRHEEPDLFEFPAEPGDRVFVCSDGACGTLTDERMADILATGTPDFAAVELVRASLEAGSTDNVTCIVADVSEEPPPEDLVPLLVGAAADLPRRMPLGGAVGGLFRGHRSGDTGEIAPGPGRRSGGRVRRRPDRPRDRPLRPPRPRAATPGCAACWSQRSSSAWPGSSSRPAGRGASSSSTSPTRTAGSRSSAASTPTCPVSRSPTPTRSPTSSSTSLSDIDAETVREGIEADDLDEARMTVDNYAARQDVDSE